MDKTEQSARESVRASGHCVPNIDAIVAEMRHDILEKTTEIVETTTRLPPAYACTKAPTRQRTLFVPFPSLALFRCTNRCTKTSR